MISYMNSCLLSIGFYNFINVWNAEINGNVPYLGKLNGHMNLVVFCKFLNSNLNALSMDERNHLRIWDVREMSTLQIIGILENQVVNCIEYVEQYDRIIIGGKQITYFEGKYLKQNKNNENLYPLNADFNVYFNEIIILTKYLFYKLYIIRYNI